MCVYAHRYTGWYHNKLWKIQQLELDMEQQTGSKSGKEHIKAVYFHPAFFNLYAEYIRWNAGVVKHKL